MVHFVGAGPGAPDLITLRGAALLQRADVVIYAGSLVNPALLENTRPGVEIYNSAEMTLEEILAQMQAAEAQGQDTVRLHTGDPSLYGAVREQMDALDALGIPWDDTPGVSSFCGAAAGLPAPAARPGAFPPRTVARLAGRAGGPERAALPALAAHGASMALFLSAGNLEGVQQALLEGAYHEDTPAAIVYKTTWPDECVVRCTVGTLAAAGAAAGITKTALLLVGAFLGAEYARSKLYDPAFTTAFREGRER